MDYIIRRLFELGYDLTLISGMESATVTKNRVDGHFFVSASNPRPIYEISITSGFYLTVSFTSEDKYAMNEVKN